MQYLNTLKNNFIQWFESLSKQKKVVYSILFIIFIWFGSSIFFNNKIDDNSLNFENNQVTVKAFLSIAEKTIKIIPVNGFTESSERVDIKSELNGKISSIIAKEGSKIKTGDAILQIEVQDRAALLTKARAQLRQVDMEFNTSKQLLDKGHQSVNKHAEINTKLDEAKANLAKAELELENTIIRAPFDGTLERIYINPGELMEIGTKVARILSNNHFLAVVYVAEKYINQLQNDNIAEININNNIYHGKISLIDTIADNKTRAFRVELEIIDNNNTIKEGMTAKVNLPINEVMSHKIATSSLSLNDAGEIGVKTLDENNIVNFYSVEIIRSDQYNSWVIGLPEIINIISGGQEFIKEGEKAKVIFVDTPLKNLP